MVDSLICRNDLFSLVFTTFAASFCLEDLTLAEVNICMPSSVAVSNFRSGVCYENYLSLVASAR